MLIAQVAQRVIDFERAIAFYESLLGQKVSASFDPPGLAFFVLGDTRLLLEREAPSAVIYLAVDDVREKTEELRSAGITVQTEPHVIFHHDDATLGPANSDEWMSFIIDSEGNTVGLVSHS